jgi:hypothetical protein
MRAKYADEIKFIRLAAERARQDAAGPQRPRRGAIDPKSQLAYAEGLLAQASTYEGWLASEDAPQRPHVIEQPVA